MEPVAEQGCLDGAVCGDSTHALGSHPVEHNQAAFTGAWPSKAHQRERGVKCTLVGPSPSGGTWSANPRSFRATLRWMGRECSQNPTRGHGAIAFSSTCTQFNLPYAT